MSEQVIFFSYSRDDSDFVLGLAKELRESGAQIWLDQLDIKAGARWDTSIEKALEAANTLLVVLSETSVGSNNVLDEVSFALEEKKTVVPVLLEDCDIPFRLRRLQFADLREDRQKGIATLISALQLDSGVAKKLADKVEVPAVTKPVEKKAQEPMPAPKTKSTSQDKTAPEPKLDKKKSGKGKTYLIGAAVIVLIGYFVVTMMGEDNGEDSGGELIEETVTLTDEEHWGLISENTDEQSFLDHQASYPDCIHAETLTGVLNAFEEMREEETAWNSAVNEDTVNGYFTYLMNYQRNGMYHGEAVSSALNKLENSGFVQFAESNGYSYFSIYGDDQITTPRTGDLILARTQRNIRQGILGSAQFDKVLYVSSENEAFMVLDVRTFGEAIWVQVAY
jgi:hypothetical protein